MTKKMVLAVSVLLLSLLFIACESPCAHGGDMIEKTVKKATCTEAGVIQTICANCGTVVRSTTVDYGGHDWKETVKEASCKETGLISIVCTRCGEKKQPDEVLAKLEHDWDNPNYAFREPTCTLDGGMFRTCKTCGTEESLTDDVIKAQGHKYETDFVVTKEATCSEKGLETRECSVCGFIDKKEIDMLPHTWGEYINQKEATCTEQGWENRTCGVCGSVEGRSIELKAHEYTYAEGDITTPPTCTTLGEANGKCKTCDKTEVVSIKRKGHAFAGNECTICQAKKGSAGLLYTLQTPTDGNEPYYTVSKGECTDSEIVIADIWREGGYDENADSPWLLVTEIDKDGFACENPSDADSKTITSIYVPASMTEIGENAIGQLYGLKTMYIEGEYNRFENMDKWITLSDIAMNALPDRIWVDYIEGKDKVADVLNGTIPRANINVGDEFVDEYKHLVKVFYVSEDHNTIYAVDPMYLFRTEWGNASKGPVGLDDTLKPADLPNETSVLYPSDEQKAKIDAFVGKGITSTTAWLSVGTENIQAGTGPGISPTIWTVIEDRRNENTNDRWFLPSLGDLALLFNAVDDGLLDVDISYNVWSSTAYAQAPLTWGYVIQPNGKLKYVAKGITYCMAFLALDLSADSI